ncbi:MAG TPA: S8 family serine peptidase [Natronosporangium sp.]
MTGDPRGVPSRRLVAPLLAAVLLAGLLTASAQASQPPLAPIEPQLLSQLAGGGSADFWVYLREEANLAPARAIEDRAAQGRFVYDRLTQTAADSQADLRELLADEGVPHQPFWIVNAVRVTGDAELLERIAARPEVAQITADRTYTLPEPIPAEAEPQTADGIEWNIDRIGAPQVWDEYGATGEGIVVGVIDGGAQFDHPAIVNQYRGNLGNGEFDHNYNWHDPSKMCGNPSLAPCDHTGHGTHVTGTIVGDDGGENRIGVAPDAKWIAARGCEFDSCSQDALLSAGQFMLAPTDLDGNNPRPELRPHIVNNSWGGTPLTDPWYQPTVNAWLEAGIFPQFAAGNTSVGVAPCGSASNPGNLPESYAAGAFDIDNQIADFSNRGASAWDETAIKPDIAAPGVDIRSAVPGDDYVAASGTSMASPHVAGAVALLWSAADALVRDVDETRALLDQTAIDMPDLTCGGEPGDNNIWGEGRLDVLAAMEQAPLGPSGRLTGAVTDAGTGDPIPGATITVTGPVNRERTVGEDGSYRFVLPAGEYTVTAAAFGYQSRTVPVTIVDQEAATVDLPLTEVDRVAVSGRVTDGAGHGWPLYARVDVPGTPLRTFTDPVTGRYQLSLPVGEEYELVATPQYPGYATAAGTVVAAGQPLTLDLAATVEDCEQAPGYQPADAGCQPVPGGLVLGQITDENTGEPVADATVTTVDSPAETGRSVATPDDPATGDGFYWLFTSRTGASVAFTATGDGYAERGETASVLPDGATELDFVLPAGRLVVDRDELAAELRLGHSVERTFTITNTGTAPAELELGEIPGRFQVLDGEPAATSHPATAPRPATGLWPATGAPDQTFDPNGFTTRGEPGSHPAGASPAAPGEVITSWTPAGMQRPWGIGVDGENDVWVSDGLDLHNYEFSVDGTPTGVVHPAPSGTGWPADLTRLGERELCQVRVFDGEGIHCFDTETGEPTRAITGDFQWTADGQRGLAYRPDDDTFYIGGWNQDIIYQVRGFSHDRPGEILHQCPFPGVSGLAWNQTAELLWVATNSATDDVFLIDPDTCAVLDTIGHPSPGFNGAGLALNDDGNLWMVSQGNEPGSPKAVYLVESGVPDVADVTWLAHTPASGTVLDPGERVTVRVTLDSAAAAEAQPGTYTARIRIGQDTPYPVEMVDVTMVATVPPGWGKVTGTVTGVDCGGEQIALTGATVQLDGRQRSTRARTGTDGRFVYWTSMVDNRLTVSASAIGYDTASGRALVTPTRDAVVDLTLHRVDRYGYRCEPVDEPFQTASTVLPIGGRFVTRTVDLPFPFEFYGQTYQQAHVCTNGLVEFAHPGWLPFGCSLGGTPLPSPSIPNAAIYAYHDPGLLVDDQASIRTELVGAAPNRRFVIEFRNLVFADLGDPTQRIDIAVVLHENGDVVTQYRNYADTDRQRGGFATIGIEDHTGSDALQYSFQRPVLPAGPEVVSIRYYPAS